MFSSTKKYLFKKIGFNLMDGLFKMGYGKVTGRILKKIKNIVGEENIFTDKDELEKYSHDEMPIPKFYFPEVVVKPENTQQISKILVLANKEKIPVTSLDEHPKLNLTIDGADEVDKNLNMIKGGGAALTREKIVGFASEKYVIIIDETKLVDKLGLNMPIPVEVLPFATSVVINKLKETWKNVKIREGKGKVGPIITDNGNFIVDVYCGGIENPEKVNNKIRSIPGVVETGLFIKMADLVYVGKKDGKIEVLTKT